MKRGILYLLMALVLPLGLVLPMAVPVYGADVGLVKGVTPATPNEYYVGDTIHYTMSIINLSDGTGSNEDIVIETVWDVLPDGSTVYPAGPSLPYTLAPGQSQSYTYDWIVNVCCGTVINTFGASGYQVSTSNDTFSEQVGKSSLIMAPSISINVEKYVWDGGGWQDADAATGPYLPPTQNPVIFKFEIDNDGDIMLTSVILTDTDISAFYIDQACTIPAVFPIGTLTSFDPLINVYGKLAWAEGQQSDTATVTGVPPVGNPVSDTDPAYYFGQSADARISIEESATNQVNDPHTFTVHVEKNDGTGWSDASGVSVTGTITIGPGSITSTNPDTTDANGVMTITVNSAVAGPAYVNAFATVPVNGVNIAVATDGYGAYYVSNVKEWTDGTPSQYGLTVSSTAGGSVATPGEGTFMYNDGTVVNLVATASNGYYFDNWSGDVGTIANAHAFTTTIIMNADYSIRANFAAIPPSQRVLSVLSTTGGAVTSPGEGVFFYIPGTVVSLVAETEQGYRFVNWTGDVDTIADASANATTITMNDDCSIIANFEEIPHNELTISSNLGGDVTTPGEGTFAYDIGAVVNLVATPAGGYRFVDWTGDVGTIANPDTAATTITMDDTYSIIANFEAISSVDYILSISKTAGGSVTGPGEGIFTYAPDAVVNLVAEPEEGYQFVSWTGDADTIDDIENAETTITMQDDYSITANFKAVSQCFIATAAYGTPIAQEIQILREFRDEYMLTNPVGEALVNMYYRLSPPVADFITGHPSLKPIVRAGLMPIVAMCSIAL